jgi:hypothetical protein
MLAYVDLYITKQEFELVSRKRQRQLRLAHHAFFTPGLYRQAVSWDKPKEWFFKGLERFANTTDAPESYQALARAFPSFWPLPLEDGKGNDLSWRADAHRLFLFYRDSLRGLWIRNPLTVNDGFQIPLLFGLLSDATMREILSGQVLLTRPLQFALSPLMKLRPRVRLFNLDPHLRLPDSSPLAYFWPDWTGGRVEYVSRLDFQRSVWLLFCESWRAKLCPKCSRYFLAEKPAQLYCSVSCSSAVHRASSLKWWKQKGSQKRAARAKQRTV